jgi:hypothetical protein
MVSRSASENGLSTKATPGSRARPSPGSAAVGLGGEERLEGVLRNIGRHSEPVSLTRSRTFRPLPLDPPAMVSASTMTLPVSMVSVAPAGLASVEEAGSVVALNSADDFLPATQHCPEGGNQPGST